MFWHLIVIVLICIKFTKSQYPSLSAENYPDPRTDPFSCHLLLPGQVCDPHAILQAEERRLLNEKIIKLQQLTANIRNTSPACSDNPVANVQIIIALFNKFGNIPLEPGQIERFTNALRSKYQNFQDTSHCDALILITNSKLDRQVFTVAGRDAKLSRDMLQTAFQRNVGHFRSGSYASGLTGMVEYIVSSYIEAHIMTTEPTSPSESSDKLGKNIVTSQGQGSYMQGVRQKPDVEESSPQNLKTIDFEALPEEDRLWVRIMAKAIASCGNDKEKMIRNIRGIVEESMELSLKLISDSHYNKIEEESQNSDNQPHAREKAWKNLKPFLNKLYSTYGQMFIRKRINQCPALKETEYNL